MSAGPDASTTLTRAVAELETVLGATDLPAALRAGAVLLAKLAETPWAVVMLLEGGDFAGEGWSADPEDGTRAALREAVRGPGDSPVFDLLRFEVAPGLVAVAAFPPATESETAERHARIAPLTRLLAPPLQALSAAAAADSTRRQYERWFRTMDEQVRVLDRERQKFAAVVQQSDSMVFVADAERRIRWTNAQMRQKSGPGESGEWLGQSCSALCSRMGEEAGHGCEDCPIQRAFEGNQIVHREFRREAARETQYHYLTALPIRDAEGRPMEVMVTVQDLGELGMLRRSEARYRLLFERSNKAILLVEPASRRILQANPMAARMTGFSMDELGRMQLEQIHGEEEWARLEPVYAAGLRQRTMEPRECRIRARDGSERIAMVAGARYDLGEQDVVMLDLQDVTDRRRVEEALRRAETSLRSVISHAPIVLFSLDIDGIFTMSEGRGLEALGLQPGEVVGRSVFDVYEQIPEVCELVRRALGGAEFTAKSSVGRLTFETHYLPVRDARGDVTGMIGVAIDVTDRQQLEEQLVHSQKMEAIGRLAGGVAHDFNNLLAAILGHCELMLGELDDEHPLREGIEEIHRAGGRGALLTRQLLAFSRRDVPAPEALDLCAVVRDLDALLRRLIGEDIELALDLPGEPCVVCADRAQVEQTVLNLVVNSRDALPEGGAITLSLRDEDVGADRVGGSGAEPGPYVRLSVIDDGCGIDPLTLAHVFEPFYTTKEQGKGTGLGLSTVYGIAERNGGWVRAESAVGEGTAFHVYLPRSGAPLAMEGPALAGPVRGGTETILIVEDESAVRDLVCEALEAQGYRVLSADSGPAALQLAEAHGGPLDLMLTDVVMPRMGGGELADKMRDSRPGLRVVFMSGYTDDAVVRHGVFEARVAFLQKPFRLDDLARKVREVLDGKAPGEERDAA